MLSKEAQNVATEARKLYEQVRQKLESTNSGDYICIEPESGKFFLGKTFDEAVNQSIDAYPDRLTHTLRIGHPAVLHLGAILS